MGGSGDQKTWARTLATAAVKFLPQLCLMAILVAGLMLSSQLH